MLAENYPFSAALLEAKRLTDDGNFGRILYAEGEYNHTGPREMLAGLTPFPYHWRGWLPRSYYVTHSLGPLMHITGQMPIQVSAFAVHSDVLEQYDDFRHNYDAFAMMNCMTDGGALFRFTGCAHMGSHSGYRIVGENGSCETGRSLGGNLNVVYHDWLAPEGKPTNETYAPAWVANGELAEKAGHGGGDFWTVYNFVNYVLNDEPVFFDVYRGCCMSAVAILGWRSCLENGKVYAIPDFKDKAQRDLWRDDDLTPFPDENGNVTLPCAVPKKQ
jgi:predicted dehydrogenase